MDNLSALLAAAPKGMWENILMNFETVFATFALSVIMLTLIIKIVMSPLDFFNRRMTSKMNDQQARLKPQLDAISKKYATQPQLKNQKTAELYKREKFNPMGSCVFMLVNMVLTLTIFISLFNGLNSMAAYKIKNQYESVQYAYVVEFAGEDTLNTALNAENANFNEIIQGYVNQINALPEDDAKKAILETANKNAVEEYEKSTESFLWIKNIWLADSPFKEQVLSFDQFVSVGKVNSTLAKDETYKETYNQIMQDVKKQNNGVNGYFVLVIISVGTAFLNQWLLTRKKSNKNANVKNAPNLNAMLIIMPLIMGVFVMLYTTMFALYIIAGQLISIAITPLINCISHKIDKNKKEKENSKNANDRMQRV